jgi:6-phosphofructokinase 1
VIPEVEMDADEVIAEIRELRERGKPHAIVVVAEGARPGVAALSERLAQPIWDSISAPRRWGTSSGVARRAPSIGCSPADWERPLSSSSPRGTAGVLVGLIRGAVAPTSLDEVVATPRRLDRHCWIWPGYSRDRGRTCSNRASCAAGSGTRDT